MARIFISYSRVDLAFVEQLYQRLQQMRPNFQVWYDQAPHGLLGGDSWWDAILGAIKDCDIFIYVLSNESVQSRYCQAEFEEACRLQKRVITIQARDRTRLTDKLGDIQYVDMKHGVNDPEALVKLSGALERQLDQVKRRRALWQPRTLRPTDEIVPVRSVDAPEVDTPLLQAPDVKTASNTQAKQEERITSKAIVSIVAILTIGAIALSQFTGSSNSSIATVTPANPQTAAVMLLTLQSLPTITKALDETTALQINLTDLVQTAAANAQATMDAYTNTPTTTFTPTHTPTINPTTTRDMTLTAQALSYESATQNAQLTPNILTNPSQPINTVTLPFIAISTLSPSEQPSPHSDVTPSNSRECRVQALNSFATVRNGLGSTDTSLLYLPLDQIFLVLGIGSRDDGTIWWKIDGNELPIISSNTWVDLNDVMELDEACNDLLLTLNISEDIFATSKTSSLAIRSSPSINSSILRTATLGEKFKISERERGKDSGLSGWWYRVDLNEDGQMRYGWIYAVNVRVNPIIEFPDWWYDD